MDNEKVYKRWSMYSEDLLNVSDDRQTDRQAVIDGNERRMPVCERCYDEIGYVWFIELLIK